MQRRLAVSVPLWTSRLPTWPTVDHKPVGFGPCSMPLVFVKEYATVFEYESTGSSDSSSEPY